jgi:signal transduction histidine kinase
VRRRITAIAVALAALVLAASAVLVVVVVQSELASNLDRSLEQRAEQIEASVESDADVGFATSNAQDRFTQVLDASGAVIGSSPNVAGVPALADLPSGRQQVRTVDDVPIEDDQYRVLIRRFDVGATTRFVVVGENVDDLRDTLRALIATLVIVFPVAVAFLGAAVWWLVGRTLRPVEEIRIQVEAIGVQGLDALDRRVPSPGTGDEVDRLADTMNEMLARLEISSARQRGFVADVSHELRTPLTRLRTNLEVDRSDPNADLVATVDGALIDAVEMQHLVDDLLFLARRDAAGADDVDRWTLVDLDVIVGDEVAAARPMAAERPDGAVGVDMSRVSAAVVRGDAAQLTRLVRNLLTNAIRHAASRVMVTVRHTDDTVELTVDDDGPGIPQEDRERVFERFVRLDPARSARAGGTGLGLAIVREVTRHHGGSVRIEQSGTGGASLLVSLPAA